MSIQVMIIPTKVSEKGIICLNLLSFLFVVIIETNPFMKVKL